MTPGNSPPISAFTVKADGLSNVLKTEVSVFQSIAGTNSKVGKYMAIWDTGATSTVITPKVVNDLGLISSGKANLKGVAGSKDNADTFFIIITLPNKVSIHVYKAVEVPQIAGDADILIGMDIINLGDFSVSNFERKTAFTFRTPSIRTIDYVEEINKLKPPQFFRKVAPNAPCPCGSNKPYKRCHGRKKY